jgi:inosine-uridine nucleoside N-ribohydrolase
MDTVPFGVPLWDFRRIARIDDRPEFRMVKLHRHGVAEVDLLARCAAKIEHTTRLLEIADGHALCPPTGNLVADIRVLGSENGRVDHGRYVRPVRLLSSLSEFNVYADPEAADVMFRANWDVTMVGLDLTHQALATKELQDRVRAVGGPIAKFILDIWEFIATTHGV